MAIYITNEEMHAIYEHVLDDLCINHREEIVEDPEKDFTRKTRMTLDRVITLTVACSSEGLKPNMPDFKEQTGIWGDLVMIPYI